MRKDGNSSIKAIDLAFVYGPHKLKSICRSLFDNRGPLGVYKDYRCEDPREDLRKDPRYKILGRILVWILLPRIPTTFEEIHVVSFI